MEAQTLRTAGRVFILLVALASAFLPVVGANDFVAQASHGETSIGIHDSSSTRLLWTPTAGAHYYTVYRGDSPADLHVLARVELSTYEDQDAPPTSIYYAIGVEGNLPSTAFAVQGEGCVSVMMSPPSVNTHLDSCVGP